LKLPRRIESVIWDFNGTVVDDLGLVLRSVNTQLAERGLPPLTLDRYRDVFGFPVEGYYRQIGLDLDVESMAELSAEFFRIYAPGLAACPLHGGVRAALECYRDKGSRQFVLSAMEERLLLRTVESLGIREFFDAVYGLAHLEADSKVSRGRDLLVDFGIRPEEALLIGDTDHDAEVAAALGTSVVLIATGHQSAARLRATGSVVVERVEHLCDSAPDPTGRGPRQEPPNARGVRRADATGREALMGRSDVA
jgi:phosphoglycolate phosphatase